MKKIKNYPVHHEEHEVIQCPTFGKKSMSTIDKINKLTDTRNFLDDKIDELIKEFQLEGVSELNEIYKGKYLKYSDAPSIFYIRDIKLKCNDCMKVTGEQFTVHCRNGFIEISSKSYTENQTKLIPLNLPIITKEEAIKFLTDVKEKTNDLIESAINKFKGE